MAQIKLYLHTKHDLDEMLETYLYVFDAKQIKRNFYSQELINKGNYDQKLLNKTLYASIKLFDKVTIMFSKWSDTFNQPYGTNLSIILSLGIDKDTFNKVYERMKEHSAFKMKYDKDTWNAWGTQITKFHDKFDNSWVLELDVRKIDNNWNPAKGNIKKHGAVSKE
ncbi:MAG: hypothetical protein NC236_00550 [Mycoplasma sp.]|nr:hypothetical protein [Mycoplasma sp.]